MNPYEAHATDLVASLQAEMGDDCPQFTWNTVNYNIIPGTTVLKKPLTVGGFMFESDFTFTVLVSEFAPAYETAVDIKSELLKSPIQYLGEKYLVQSVHILPGAFQMKVEANRDQRT